MQDIGTLKKDRSRFKLERYRATVFADLDQVASQSCCKWTGVHQKGGPIRLQKLQNKGLIWQHLISSCGSSRHILIANPSGDDLFHDLGRSAVDSLDSCIHISSGNGVFHHVAIPEHHDDWALAFSRRRDTKPWELAWAMELHRRKQVAAGADVIRPFDWRELHADEFCAFDIYLEKFGADSSLERLSPP